MKSTASYSQLNFKIPKESRDYQACSDYVIGQIDKIINNAIVTNQNKIVINTSLKRGLPMENINKVAGPFVEAWAFEVFANVADDANNPYKLVNVQANDRLNKSDIILQFRKEHGYQTGITSEIDVKATAEDIVNSGKSPNVTSFAVIRTAYIEDPDLMFLILSLKHRVYSQKNVQTNLMDGIMEVVSHNTYDIKYLGRSDISYNPALGTGQIQIRDIHYVEIEHRTAWEFCQLLDGKYLQSKKRSFNDWLTLANKNGWIKSNE